MNDLAWTSADDEAVRQEANRKHLLERLQEMREQRPDICQAFVSEYLTIRSTKS